MRPSKRNGGPAEAPVGSARARSQVRPQDSRAGRVRGLVAAGEFHPPAGRRTLGVVVVRSCPACHQMHLHRAETVGSAHMAERVGSCGATYLLNVHHALPIGGVA